MIIDENWVPNSIKNLGTGIELNVFLQQIDNLLDDFILNSHLSSPNENYTDHFINYHLPEVINTLMYLDSPTDSEYEAISKTLNKSVLLLQFSIININSNIINMLLTILDSNSSFYQSNKKAFECFKGVVYTIANNHLITNTLKEIDALTNKTVLHFYYIILFLNRLKPNFGAERFNKYVKKLEEALKTLTLTGGIAEFKMFIREYNVLGISEESIKHIFLQIFKKMLENEKLGADLLEFFAKYAANDSFVKCAQSFEIINVYIEKNINLSQYPTTFSLLLENNCISEENLIKIFENSSIDLAANLKKEQGVLLLKNISNEKLISLLGVKCNFNEEACKAAAERIDLETILSEFDGFCQDSKKAMHYIFYQRFLQTKDIKLLEILKSYLPRENAAQYIEILADLIDDNKTAKEIFNYIVSNIKDRFNSKFTSLLLNKKQYSIINERISHSGKDGFTENGYKTLTDFITTNRYKEDNIDLIKLLYKFIKVNSIINKEIHPKSHVTVNCTNFNCLAFAFTQSRNEQYDLCMKYMVDSIIASGVNGVVLISNWFKDRKPKGKAKYARLFINVIEKAEQNININEYGIFRFEDPIPEFYVNVQFNNLIVAVPCHPSFTINDLVQKLNYLYNISITGITVGSMVNPDANYTLQQLSIRRNDTIIADYSGEFNMPFIPTDVLRRNGFQNVLIDSIIKSPILSNDLFDLLILLPQVNIDLRILPEMIEKNKANTNLVKYFLTIAYNNRVNVCKVASELLSNEELQRECIKCIQMFPNSFDVQNFPAILSLWNLDGVDDLIIDTVRKYPQLTPQVIPVIKDAIIKEVDWGFLQKLVEELRIENEISDICIGIINEKENYTALKAISTMAPKITGPAVENILGFLMNNKNDSSYKEISKIVLSHPELGNKAELYVKFLINEGIKTSNETCIISASEISQMFPNKTYTKFLTNIAESRTIVWNYDKYSIRKSTLGIPGLRNLGATCYASSTIQQLAFLPSVFKLINEANFSDEVLQKFQMILRQLKLTKRSFINPEDFIVEWSGFGEKINPHEQHDVAEFMLCLMNQLPIIPLFEGSLKNRQTVVEDKFAILPVTLGNGELDVSHFNVAKSPKILAIQLIRFSFNKENLVRSKINDRCTFPLELDFGTEHYKFKGAILHKGTPMIGHYMDIININEKWVKFNDAEVTELTQNDALKECYGDLVNNESAYLLFYVATSLDQNETTEIPTEAIKEIEKDNKVFMEQELAFEDVCFRIIPKASKEIVIKYFANIFIHSRMSKYCSDFERAIIPYISDPEFAKYTLELFTKRVEYAFATVSSQDITKLLCTVITNAFHYAPLEVSGKFIKSLLSVFKETSTQWRQAQHVSLILDTFLNLPGAVEIAIKDKWADIIAKIVTSALGKERSSTFIENCDINILLRALESVVTPESNVKCILKVADAAPNSRSATAYYNCISKFALMGILTLSEACTYTYNGGSLSRKNQLIFNRIAASNTRKDIEKVYVEAAELGISAAQILDQFASSANHSRIKKCSIDKLHILIIDGLLSSHIDERRSCINLAVQLNEKIVYDLMIKHCGVMKNSTPEFFECLYNLALKFRGGKMPKELRRIIAFIDRRYMKDRKFEIRLLLLFNDEEVNQKVFGVFSELANEENDNSFKYAVPYIPYINKGVLSALMKSEPFKKKLCSDLDNEMQTYFINSGVPELINLVFSYFVQTNNVDRLSMFVNPQISNEALAELAKIANENHSLLLLDKLTSLRRSFYADPKWIANIAKSSTDIAKKYYTITHNIEIIKILESEVSTDIQAGEAIAVLDPDQGCRVASTLHSKQCTNIVKVLIDQVLTKASSRYIVVILYKHINEDIEKFLIKNLCLCNPHDFVNMSFKKDTDIKRVALVCTYLPEVIPMIKDKIIKGMSMDFYKNAEFQFFEDKKKINAMFSLHSPPLSMPRQQSQANPRFGEGNPRMQIYEKNAPQRSFSAQDKPVYNPFMPDNSNANAFNGQMNDSPTPHEPVNPFLQNPNMK